MLQETAVEPSRVPVLNLPNVLTVGRIFLVPVMAVMLLRDTAMSHWIGLLIYCVAVATDKIDGDIARARGLITNFGKIADPIADKALVLTALIILNIWGSLPVWVTLVIAIREIAITAMRLVMAKNVVIAASTWGKLKTVSQMLMIFIMLIPWYSFATPKLLAVMPAVNILLWSVAVVLTVLSGLDYGIKAWRGYTEQKNVVGGNSCE